jgi:hypothetical protein
MNAWLPNQSATPSLLLILNISKAGEEGVPFVTPFKNRDETDPYSNLIYGLHRRSWRHRSAM